MFGSLLHSSVKQNALVDELGGHGASTVSGKLAELEIAVGQGLGTCGREVGPAGPQHTGSELLPGPGNTAG